MELPAKLNRTQIQEWLNNPVTKTVAAGLEHRCRELKKAIDSSLNQAIESENSEQALRQCAVLKGIYDSIKNDLLNRDFYNLIVDDIRALSPPLGERDE